MSLVVDANIVFGYYMSSAREEDSGLTADPKFIFESGTYSIYVDDGSQIENEWRNVVEREWFDAWYPDLLLNDTVRIINVSSSKNLIKALCSLGFPRTKDKWYIRTAEVVKNSSGMCYIVTEDIDFFDPKKKKSSCDTKIRIKKNSKGPVANHLKKNNIVVRCVEKL